MEIIEKLWCSRCGAKNVPLIKYSKVKQKNHINQYHHCRDCANKRGRIYYSENKEKCKAILAKSILKHKEKQVARVLLNLHVGKHRNKKPGVCVECGAAESRIEAHHTNYSKPLEVTWLCTDCHSKVHKVSCYNINTTKPS